MNRPKISVFIAASLDGYIAKEDYSLDWLEKYNHIGEDYGFFNFFGSIDSLVVGRKTFEPATKGPHWPYPGKRVIVLSNTVDSVGKAEVYKGEIAPLVSKLHQEGVKHIWIDGGVTIAQFLKEKMVDFITLTTVPTLLGGGVPLFLPTAVECTCDLMGTKTYKSGMVQASYKLTY